MCLRISADMAKTKKKHTVPDMPFIISPPKKREMFDWRKIDYSRDASSRELMEHPKGQTTKDAVKKAIDAGHVWISSGPVIAQWKDPSLGEL